MDNSARETSRALSIPSGVRAPQLYDEGLEPHSPASATVKQVRPSFSSPPVVEQAISVMFDPIDGFTIGDIGLFWNEVRSEFPECAAQEPLSRVIEKFGQPEPVRIELAQSIPRAMLGAEGSGELLQIQNDRFGFNWMLTEGRTYPRHDATIERFWKLFSTFLAFLRGRGLRQPSLLQCELVNVNIVSAKNFGRGFTSLLDAFSYSLPEIDQLSNLRLEGAQIATHYVIVDDQSKPLGRVHTSLHPVRNVSDGEEAIRFDISARGAAEPPNQEGAAQFFECARSAINATFLAHVSADARRRWGEQT